MHTGKNIYSCIIY